MAWELGFTTDGIDWQHLAGVFERAPLGVRGAAALEQVFRGSTEVCFARLDGVLVGAGRALSDRLAWTIIFDVVVEPPLQGQGMGRAIIDALAARCAARNVMLQSVPGREAFYRRLGFARMTTAMARYRDPPWAVANGYVAPD